MTGSVARHVVGAEGSKSSASGSTDAVVEIPTLDADANSDGPSSVGAAGSMRRLLNAQGSRDAVVEIPTLDADDSSSAAVPMPSADGDIAAAPDVVGDIDRIGLPLSVASTWEAIPKVSKFGDEFVRVQTNGNGACSAHALWGVPGVNGDIELHAGDQIRSRLMASLPSSWEEMLRLRGGVLSGLLGKWMAGVQSDLAWRKHDEMGTEDKLLERVLTRT